MIKTTLAVLILASVQAVAVPLPKCSVASVCRAFEVQAVDWTEEAAPALSSAGHAKVYADSSSHTLKASLNGGAYATLGGGGSSQWTTSGADIFNNNAGKVKIGISGDGTDPMLTVQSNGIIIGNGATPTAGTAYIVDSDDAVQGKALSAVGVDGQPTLLIGQEGGWGQIKVSVYDGVSAFNSVRFEAGDIKISGAWAPATGQALCLDASHNLGHCTSVVGVGGACTCVAP